MKKLLALLFVLVVSIGTYAQNEQKKDTSWKIGGESSLIFSQVSLSNWAAGGENSLAANAYFNLFANYKKGNVIWENKFEIAYGLQKQGEESLRKSDDKLYFSSTYGKKAFKKWYYTGSFSLKSQFTNGYNYPDDTQIISKFFAPAYLLLSFGLEYKPNDFFMLNISPISGKMTVVNSQILADAGAFGVDPGKKSRSEFGGSLSMNFKQEIAKNIEFKTKLEMFTNYAENPENIDVDWEVFINMKVNDLITTTFTTHLIYDDDIDIIDKDGMIGPRTQFKEIFGVGITYKF